MSACLPHTWMHKDGSINAYNICAVGHGLPPALLDRAEQFNAEGSEIPATIKATIDFGTLKNKALALCKGKDCVEV